MNGSKEFRFRGFLKKYDASNSSSLNEKLEEYVRECDAAGFCQTLSEVTNLKLEQGDVQLLDFI